jgi:hypothetical protein
MMSPTQLISNKTFKFLFQKKKINLIFLNLNFAKNYEIPVRICESVILFILVHKDLSNFRCPNLNQLNRHCSNSNLSTAAFITAG